MDSSLQTHVLGHWVREKQALTLEEAVRQLSFVPASHWGLRGRGLLREGWNADVVIFDPQTVRRSCRKSSMICRLARGDSSNRRMVFWPQS